MKERTIADLEVEKALDLVRRHCLSDGGRAAVSPSAFMTDTAQIESRAKRVGSIIELLAKAENTPSHFPSLDSLFEAEERNETQFDGADMKSFASWVNSLQDLGRFISDPFLCPDSLSSLAREIDDSLESDGSVKETHPLLRPLFRALDSERARRQAWTSEALSKDPGLYQSREAVYRNERVALAVKRERKSEVGGYVQGSSSTGSTLFVEPFELVELNNRVTLAEDEIMRMRRKILMDLSVKVRRSLDEVRNLISFVSDFDFHYAFACEALRNKWAKAKFGDTIELIDARHPLLFDKAVPISLSVGEDVKVVVLSGANAGGKTVTMKTVALLSTIAQTCGWAPFAEGSVLPVFTGIFTDIGDGQSILENFSTFSGHMSNVAAICREAGEGSLVLLDEIGSGTDPAEGASLTDSLLDWFKERGSTLFITSHYSQVKMHAWSDSRMLNASMEFDESTDRPTYRVISGLPGDSHAIAIAKRMGLPREVIREAKENLSGTSSVSQLIASLNGKSRALDRKITELELEKRELKRREEEYKRKEAEVEKLKADLEQGSADELRVWMKETRKRLEKLVRDVGSGNLTKEKTKAVRDFISGVEEKSAEADRRVSERREREIQKRHYDFKVGDEVLCGSFNRRGVILRDLGKGRWQVSIDSMKINLTSADLKPAPEEKKATVSPYKVTTPKPRMNLDLRGKILEEALAEVDSEIESCLVHSVGSFSVIHGYGNGILSQGIHNYLSKQKGRVKDYYFANPDDGGMGKTYVLLNL